MKEIASTLFTVAPGKKDFKKMPPKEPGIFKLFLGNTQEFSLERRVLNAATLAGGLVSSLITLEMLVIGMPWQEIMLSGGATVFLGILYGLGRACLKCSKLASVFLLIIGMTVILDWFVVTGVHGVGLPILVALSGIVPIIIRKNRVFFGWILIGTIYTALILGTSDYFNLMPQNQPTPTRMLDLIIETAILSVGLGTITYLAAASSRMQKEKAEALSLKLEEANRELESRNRQLEQSLQEVKTLRGIIPICSGCGKIRNDEGFYELVADYLSRHTDADFSHTVCPKCARKLYPDLFDNEEENN